MPNPHAGPLPQRPLPQSTPLVLGLEMVQWGVTGQEAAHGVAAHSAQRNDRIPGAPSPRPPAPHLRPGQAVSTELRPPGRGAPTGSPRAVPGPQDPASGAAGSFAWPRLSAAIGGRGRRPGLSGCGAVGRRGWGCGEPSAQDAGAAAAGRVRGRVDLRGSREPSGRVCVCGGCSGRALSAHPPAMSRKKIPKSKGASAPTASVLPAANGPRAGRPRTARPGSEAPQNGPPQPGRPSLGGGGDFYDVAFKVSRAPPPPMRVQQVASGKSRSRGVPGQGCRALRTLARNWLELAGAAGTAHRARTHSCQTWVWDTQQACPLPHPQMAG